MDIETAKSLKPGAKVQVPRDSWLRKLLRYNDIPVGVDLMVTGEPVFKPNSYRGGMRTEDGIVRVYRDNVIVPLTDGRKHFSLTYEHLL
jgi:hypothetical protein